VGERGGKLTIVRAYSAEAAADRAGVTPAEFARIINLGLLQGNAEDGYTDADVRRAQLVQTLERAEMPIEGFAELVRSGRFSLAFLDEAWHIVLAALTDTTFEELAHRTGIPVELLLVLREVSAGRDASPGARVREDELRIVPLVQLQVALGFRPTAIERALRVYADSLRRVAETEAEWFRTEFQAPMFAAGATPDEVGRRVAEIAPQLSAASDEALLAIYHAQQMRAWATNIVDGIALSLEQAGLHRRPERLPAMCFLDLTGYTALTEEHGDSAAVHLAERLNRIVERIVGDHDGRPVKWLGDGVMCYFPEAGRSVPASLAMIDALREADLPPAHVGLHAGPVVFQEGDYYGQTVNVAARIGEYARPGEVLVSRAVVDATTGGAFTFVPVGPVELKGLSWPIDLFVARRSADPPGLDR